MGICPQSERQVRIRAKSMLLPQPSRRQFLIRQIMGKVVKADGKFRDQHRIHQKRNKNPTYVSLDIT